MRSRLWVKALSAVVLVLGLASRGHAGRLGPAGVPGAADSYLTPYGSGAGVGNGDYISDAAGLNQPYRFFVEVPPSLGRLVVDLFDADIGAGGANETFRDVNFNGTGYNTSVLYTVLDPAGTVRATLTGNAFLPADNVWNDIFDTNYPQLVTQTQTTLVAAAQTITIAVPAGTAAGDLLLAVVSRNSGQTIAITPSAAGWNTANEGPCNASAVAGTCRLGVFWRIAGAAEPANYTFNWTGAGAGNQLATGAMLRYTSVNATQLDVAAAFGTGNTAAPIAPTVNTATVNTRVVRVMAADTNSLASNVIPTGLVGRVAQVAGTAVSLALADVGQAATGGAGTATFTLTGAQTWRTVTLAIRRAAAAPTPQAGHWEVRADSSSAVTAGSDNNAFGLRAHDGTPGAGGTELNVYADSNVEVGLPVATGLPAGSTRVYNFYPYVVSGCSCLENDFDFDSNQGLPAQQVAFSSRTGSFTSTVAPGSLSANGAWNQDAVPAVGAGWTTDSTSVDYGIWTEATTIQSFGTLANYGTQYVGNFQAGGPAPGGNPTPNAFRLYFPTDGGAAPVKPYLEQLLTYVSGARTPVFTTPIATPTTLSVTVRVVNPTPYAITFSATNLVTVNVPATPTVVTYQGNAQVSQGAAPTAPGLGGTGNITWNPGILAAGGTGLLSFNVRITPTAAGQRIPVVGTPASTNGTRAQFVDETGNTTQARATMTLGPICELAATVGLLTPAVVSSVRAHPHPGGVEVEWRTASEVGTVGFDLLRFDPVGGGYVTLNKALLPSLLGSPQGGRYRFVDEGASPVGRHWYALSEVMASGERRVHGPYDVQVEAETSGSTGRAPARAYDRVPRSAPVALARSLAAHRQAMGRPRPSPRGAPTSMEIGVERTGLYFVSTTSIASTIQLPAAQVQALMAARLLSLSNQGRSVAWTPAPGGLLFYGRAVDSVYTTDNVYWLAVGTGLVMGAVDGGRPGPTGAASFLDHVHAEENHLAATLVSTDPDSDYWYWDFLSGGDPAYGDKSFPLTAPGADPTGGPGRLQVHLHGATTTGVAGEHHVVVSLNGSPVGETQWQGITPQTLDVAISPALIHDGSNTVEVKALLDTGVPYSIFYLDSIDLSYDRLYQAAGSALAFQGDGHGVVTVGGFAEAAVAAFDVTDPLRPRRVGRATVDGSAGAFRLSLVPSGPDEAYFAATPAAWLAPKWARGYRSVGLKSARGADYVIVTTADLREPAERLAALRQRSGLQTRVVDVADVMNEFNSGISDPRALRSFLQYASRRWSPAPRFLLLAGQGTFDYKDYLGNGDNLVPPLMVSTPSGLFASDNHLVDLDDDGTPDIAVGRVPVLTAAELDGYVSKMAAYDASDGGEWKASALWLADRASNGADFPSQAESLVPGIPEGYTTERIYLEDGTIALSRARLLADLNAGAGLMNYVGHGALDQISSDGLLFSSDAPNLANGERLPFMTALTCIINRFEVPGFSSLGGELVKSAGGGVSAVWAPTGLSVDVDARVLGQRFYAALHSRPNAPVGELVREALKSYAATGGEANLVNVYSLLGDPAVRLKMVAPPDAPPGPGGTSTSRTARPRAHPAGSLDAGS